MRVNRDLLLRIQPVKRYITAFITVVLVSLLSNCSSASNTTTPPAAPAGGNTVEISNFAFTPASLSITVGTKVTWTNKDNTAHTVSADGGVFGSGSMAPKATFDYTFNTAGTFTYTCSVHPYMKGTIVVR